MRTDRARASDIDVFISYNRLDAVHARWLANYLRGLRLLHRSYQAPFKRVFLDQEELGAAPSLSDALKRALSASRRLCVVLSENSISSNWVRLEIQEFRHANPTAPIFVFYCGRQSLGSAGGLRGWAESCGHANHTLFQAFEPLAADATSEGRRVAAARLVAGMLDISYDTLSGRRLRARAAALSVALVTLGASLAGTEAVRRSVDQQRLENEFVARALEEPRSRSPVPIVACCLDVVQRQSALAATLLEQVNDSDLAHRPRLDPDALAISAGEMGASNWRLSIDGGYVLGTEREVRIRRPNGQRVQATTTYFIASALWSPTLRMILLARGDGTVQGVTPSGEVRDVSAYTCGRLSTLMGGYVLQSCQGRLVAVNLRNQQSTQLPGGRLHSWSRDGRFIILDDNSRRLLLDLDTRRSLNVSTYAEAAPFGAIDRPEGGEGNLVALRVTDSGAVDRRVLNGVEGLIDHDENTREPYIFGTTGIHRVVCNVGGCDAPLLVRYHDGRSTPADLREEVGPIIDGITNIGYQLYDLNSGVSLFELWRSNYQPHVVAIVRVDGRLLGLTDAGPIVWREERRPFSDLAELRDWVCEDGNGLIVNETGEINERASETIGARRFPVCDGRA